MISPYKASGTEMARLALHPQLSGVVDVDSSTAWRRSRSATAATALGQTVGDIRGGSMIVGLRRGTDFQPQPPPRRHCSLGDVILAMGTPTTLERLEQLLQAVPARS